MLKPQRRWSLEEDAILEFEVAEGKSWAEIARKLPRRTNKDCRKRFFNPVVQNLKKGQWTEEEDALLKEYVAECGLSWAVIAEKMTSRNADQCSKRWQHSLDPELDHSSWTDVENSSLCTAVDKHGTFWKYIQKNYFPKRSANNVKNQFTILKRRTMMNKPADAPSNRQQSTLTKDQNCPEDLPEDPLASEPFNMELDVDFKDILNFEVTPDTSNWMEGYDSAALLDIHALDQEEFSFHPNDNKLSSQALYCLNQGHTLEDMTGHPLSCQTSCFLPSSSYLRSTLDQCDPGILDLPQPGIADADMDEDDGDEIFEINLVGRGQTQLITVASSEGIHELQTREQYLKAVDLCESKNEKVRQATLTLDNPDPNLVMQLLDILVKSNTRMKFNIN